ncbi:MAG: serine/threonine protein kinase [Acidobacteria bacterium]|nr:serine/threonine protein kinase [Acidobacteriota bacterium]
MTPEQWAAAKALFGQALSMAAEDRDRFLREHCPEELRAEVRELLEAERAAGDFLQSPVFDFQGRWFGPYRAIRELGRGGMGVVYLAERTDAEFHKQVAVKLVPSSLFSAELLRRFHQERQILASLEHPHIARLLDGGTTPEGHPYLVMEYVDGEPLDQYCRRPDLSLPARLHLFRKICEAVQFAHRSLIVHRDLKPGNLLVNRDGEPKLLDFGIAKILSPEPTPETTVARAWTADYASPEQLLGKKITTSSDVYSLGLLLYELLTGRRAQPCGGKALDAVLRTVCAEAPPKPSSVAGKGLAGDLDAITMRAIEKEPERRYGSAEELSAEIDRYLAGRPVLAQEPTLGYLARRFVGRHRLAVTGAVMALVLAVAAAGAILWQVGIARRERAEAQRRFELVRKLAGSMIHELHDQIAPLPGSLAARRTLVSQALDYLERVGREAEGQVPLQLELAAAYRRLGEVQGDPEQFNLGDTPGALRSLERASRILEPLRGRPEAARELVSVYLAESNVHGGAGATAAAIQAARQAVETSEQLVRHAPRGYEERYLRARAYSALALTGTAGELQLAEKARQILEGLLAERPEERGPRRALATVEHRVGAHYVAIPQAYGQAFPHLARALELNEGAARADPADRRTQMDISMQCYLMGICLLDRGDLPAAESHVRRAVEIRRGLAAADPFDVHVRDGLAAAHRLLGDVQAARNRTAAAMEQYRSALAVVAALDSRQPNLVRLKATRAHSHLGIARLQARMGRHAAACAAFAAAHSAYRSLGENLMSVFDQKEAGAAAAGYEACLGNQPDHEE